jgi:rhodanese-related sulfurtransferase
MQQVTPTTVVEWINEGKAPLILDVREPWELETASLAQGKIDARVLAIPMRQIPAQVQQLQPDDLIVCFCHHGTRSMQVGLFLEHHGFSNVVNLSGGIDAWSRTIDPSIAVY